MAGVLRVSRGSSGGGAVVTGARFDLPEVDAFTRPYWDAAAEGRLLLRRCGACGRAHHYPREFCPHCWSEDVHLGTGERPGHALHLVRRPPQRPPAVRRARPVRRRRRRSRGGAADDDRGGGVRGGVRCGWGWRWRWPSGRRAPCGADVRPCGEVHGAAEGAVTVAVSCVSGCFRPSAGGALSFNGLMADVHEQHAAHPFPETARSRSAAAALGRGVRRRCRGVAARAAPTRSSSAGTRRSGSIRDLDGARESLRARAEAAADGVGVSFCVTDADTGDVTLGHIGRQRDRPRHARRPRRLLGAARGPRPPGGHPRPARSPPASPSSDLGLHRLELGHALGHDVSCRVAERVWVPVRGDAAGGDVRGGAAGRVPGCASACAACDGWGGWRFVTPRADGLGRRLGWVCGCGWVWVARAVPRAPKEQDTRRPGYGHSSSRRHVDSVRW